MTDISVEQLISIRQFAIDTAADVAKMTQNPGGLLADAANIEAYILNGAQRPAPSAEAGVGEAEPPKPAVRSRARKK